MKNLSLYLKYAWRSIQRGGQRTFFAILCVAVGVASIVALQTTGNSITDTVAGDARAAAGADVIVSHRQSFFNADDLAKFDALKQNKTIEDYATFTGDLGGTVLKKDGSKSNDFASFYSVFPIDPAKYPFYGKNDLESPAGKTMRNVLTGTGQVVINNKMATSIGAKVGDKIKITGESPAEVTVVGILNTKATAPGVDSGQAEFLGFAYLTPDTAKQIFKADTLIPSQIFVKTSNDIGADVKARDAIKAASSRFNPETATEHNDQTKKAYEGVSTLLTYVGLISLLIGSVGVVNTMLVVVGRRSTEIATIKSLGMESGQTVRIFVLEAGILGVMGSIIGVILGEVLAIGTSRAAEGFINQSLEYRFYWGPVFMGLAVGIVTALVFGLLPAYSASKIPPAQVLRQKTNALPRISLIATLFIILLMTLVMGTMAGVILNGQLVLGLIVAFATLVSCAILIAIFSGILWLVGKIPLPFGLNYKMARRNLSRGRAKAATTVLVMMVGVFAMSVVLILSGSLKDTIKDLLEKSFGFNVAVQTTTPEQSAAVVKSLDSNQVPGLEKYLVVSQTRVRWTKLNATPADQVIADKVAKDAADPNKQNQGGGFNTNPTLSILPGLNSKDLTPIANKIAGEFANADNQVTITKEVRDAYNVKVGDTLTFTELASGQELTFTVSGVIENKNVIVGVGDIQATVARVQQLPGHRDGYNLTVNKDKVAQAQDYLKANFPGADVVDLSYISNVINKILDNVTAFPLLLGFLCLIAGAVLIANNVALAVLERRTEMGVMKSLGADSARVLTIINLESVIVGFIGGIYGLVIAIALAATAVQNFGTADNPGTLTVSPVVSIGMILLAIGLAIGATMLSAFGAAREKPMVVLRYE